MAGTQPSGTQGASTQGNTTLASYVAGLNRVAAKLDIADPASTQIDLSRMEQAIVKLSENGCERLGRLLSHLCAEALRDDCKYLAECAVLFFRMCRACKADSVKARQAYFCRLLEHLYANRAHLTAFVDLCNLFSDQSARMPVDQLVGVLDTVTAKIKVATETSINDQWRDCLSILISRLLENAEGGEKTGAQIASTLLGRWLRESKNITVFANVVAIIEKCRAGHVLRAYVQGDLQKALDSFESLKEEEQRECSLRVIEVMDKSEDEGKSERGARERLLKALINIWRLEKRVEEGQGDSSTQPKHSDSLNPSICTMHAVLQAHAVIGKQLLALFKADRAALLSSQFGFAALVSVVATDRHGAAALAEMKKCVAQLFRVEGDLMSSGWVAECMGGVTEALTQQMRSFVRRLTSNDELWLLLSPALLRLSYALLETAQGSTPLAISDGRIVNGPRVWMLGAEMIRTVVVSKPTSVSVGASLLQLVEAISAATSSNAALVMIDILVEVVREHSADVLNNTKVLESISEYASRLRRDVSISLIRSLLPVFHQRVHLREALMMVLKKDLLHEKTVACAVPLLLLLFHSLSRSAAGGNASQRSQFSQSFATFSSQSLAGMGMARPRDSALCLQIIGCLRRCLSQSAPLKSALYMGLANAITRETAATAAPCLDLLLGHATSLPEWRVEGLVQSNESLCTMREALPQFIYALNSVTNSLMAAAAHAVDESQHAGDALLEQATDVLNGWAKRAAERELDELALDKVANWNRATAEGRATVLFGACIKGVYDALVGYLWTRVAALEGKDELQWLNAILGRKKALRDLMGEAMVKRKDVRAKGGENGDKVKETVQIDEKSCEVPVAMSTLADILEELVGKEEQRADLDGLSLLTWTIEKIKTTAEGLDKPQHTEVHERTSTASVIAVARWLLVLYKGDDECAEWLRGLEAASPLKTAAIAAYSHLLHWLLSRHVARIDKIASIWRRGGSEENAGGTNGELMRHINMVVSKLLPALLSLVRSVDEQDDEGGERDRERRKEARAELETQIKTLLRIVEHLLSLTTNPKSPATTFRFCVTNLLKREAANNAVLRDIFRLMRVAALRSPHADGFIDKFLESLSAQLIACIDDVVLEDTLDCVTPLAAAPISDFLIATIEDDLDKMRALTAFTAHYASDEEMVSKVLGAVAARAVVCVKRLAGLMGLHHKSLAKDKLTALLTACFTTLDEFFKKLQDVSKPFSIKQWKMLPTAHSVVTALSRLLGVVDESVGTITKEDREERKKAVKRRYARTKKEEALFIKFVRAREGVQSRVIILSKTLDDAKFNLVVRNNTIGIRDFRIDSKMLTETIKRAAELDDTLADASVGGQPQRKKKRRSNDQENERPGSPVV